ncbi:hypothetical protein LCGC14_1615940, partial [marine sediment metagenome]
KIDHGLLKQKEGHKIEMRIREAMSLMRQVDEILLVKNVQVREDRMNRLRARFSSLNSNSAICKKKELRWPVKSIRFNLPRIIWAALGGK